MIRALIVDDEPLALRGLELSLSKHPQIEIVGKCINGREALDSIRTLRPDVLFIDIRMPGLTGFDVIRTLPEDDAPYVVFVSAFDKYAVKAFEVNAFDYILKPLDDEQVTRTVEKLSREIDNRQKLAMTDQFISAMSHSPASEWDPAWPRTPEQPPSAPSDDHAPLKNYSDEITLRDGARFIRLQINDIELIEAEGDYVNIHAGPRTYLLRQTMKRMEERLNPEQFERVHRSAIVNLKMIREAQLTRGSGYKLVLKSGHTVKVGRNHRKRVTERFTNASR